MITTYLPHTDFKDSAWALDPARLKRQCEDALRVARCLQNGVGFQQMPAARMWSLWFGALLLYAKTMCQVWETRNPGSTAIQSGREEVLNIAASYGIEAGVRVLLPAWRHSTELIDSHRSALLAADRAGNVRPHNWYVEQNWRVPCDLPMWWPCDHGWQWGWPPSVGLES